MAPDLEEGVGMSCMIFYGDSASCAGPVCTGSALAVTRDMGLHSAWACLARELHLAWPDLS